MPDYIEELNESQRAAVLYGDGPSLVIAGAGSGKTRVLTYKIAYLLENGYNPWNILALTFTNKAAREMKERIARQVGEQRARYLWMGTFHSVFSRILRAEASHIGFTSQFTIYDSADSKSLLRSIIKEMGLDEKTYKPGSVQARISNAKNHLVSPSGYATNKEAYEADAAVKMPAIRDIYSRYWERCRQAGAMDFDDLLVYTYILFRDFPEVLARYREQFRYVLVDEYQDTNYAQHSIVLQLTKENQRVCVVGDDAQSIYSFRGADIDNILYFTKIYPDTKVFKLEQNYRSTQTIVRAANSLIEKNERQIPKEVFSEKERGEAIGVFQAYSDVEEGDIVTNKIAQLRREHDYGYSDFAILYRTNAQSRVFEEALRKRSMPYKIYGGLSFYQRKEIKDIIAYFRLVVNPNDEEAFKRIINYPARGIGDTTVGKIIKAATDNNVSLWTVLCDPITYGLTINKNTHTKLQGFRELIEQFMTEVAEKNAYEIGTAIIRQSGIINDVCQDNSPENLSRKENIEELVNGMNDFCAMRQEEGNTNVSLIDFLSEVSLLTDQDSDKEGDGEKVTLMTVHSAKGLEFRNVFVVGLEENLFPSGMAGDSPRAMEEERRLFYVAITRAEEHCFLSFAKTRFRYGKMECGSPSRFLRDIDTRFLQLPQEAALGRSVDEGAGRFRREMEEGYSRRPSAERFSARPSADRPQRERPKEQIIAPTVPRNLKRVSGTTVSPSVAPGAGITGVQPGQTIEHERFGIGQVIRVEGSGDNAKATIHFRNAGDKQLLLRFARFKVIE
ncbi:MULTISPECIES: ATP-dependent helicase [Bacteroides]|jgi:DNA helicase-2/ATP-dependent DNA helicase PcrA|uniref:DNA 3'-5' helicase n=1 Tax=Bacteroides fragilis TaxID=817 RepID=A0A413K0Z4_BACFG|nr:MULTISPECIES: UvrD-helicase domain-containing protein [Bacteroides]MBU3040743.1 UvrD-helicase domain-containing protein [Bacteroides sp. HF-4919]MBY2893896.1 ATP-dependent DNA helicase [Bacteroides fragilis]MCM0222222.1 UvrD-helicase domain-containing protein [Bacteroides fragilis]MCM0298978.1 UvrD-helicase domain-containing protein [Bacteroides fragilis]MCM0360218.1 UvrD-helicase domain-containing protein [Bacteroides fragilis]